MLIFSLFCFTKQNVRDGYMDTYTVSHYFFYIVYFSNGASWSWSYGSWIYDYLCNRCLSPLSLWIRIPLRRGVFDTILCDKVCQWLATGWWFSPGTPVSSVNKTDRHDIVESGVKHHNYHHNHIFQTERKNKWSTVSNSTRGEMQ